MMWSLFAPRPQRFAAAHEHPSPAIGGGIEEHPELLTFGRWILRAAVELQRWVHDVAVAVTQPAVVVFEGEHLLAARWGRRERTDPRWAGQSCPVGDDVDDAAGAHGAGGVDGVAAPLRLRRGARCRGSRPAS